MRRSQTPKCSTPRLACVRPAASVHPEPGSNSSSYIFNNFRQRYTSLISLKYIKPYSCFVLSIQYVYELSFSYYIACLSKRVQKYKSFFNLQNFLMKFLKFFQTVFLTNIPLNFSDCKDKTFYHYNPNLFSKKLLLIFQED